MTSNPKTVCAAFGCKRWTRRFPEGWQYLCLEHYAMAPKRLRRLYQKSKRRLERFGVEKENERGARLWAKCVEAANKNIGI